MTAQTFAEVFSEVLDKHGCSPSEAAHTLQRYGVYVHRSTLIRWQNGETNPSVRKLDILRLLPQAIGLSQVEEIEFLKAASLALGFEVRRPQASAAFRREAPFIFAQRLHYGAEQLPPFAGRDKELDELRQLVLKRQSVAIVGPGGIGKTRLAQELLHTTASHFAHGCEYLQVAPAQDVTRIVRNVSRLLGLEPTIPGQEPDRQLLDRLQERLQDVRLLFVLDGVDRADQVRDLVVGLPAVTWVITTRRAGLKRLGVSPLKLALPGLAEAIAIFQAYLRHVAVPDRYDESAVGQLVNKLGRLPLALRLSASLVDNGVVPTVAGMNEWLDRRELRRGGFIFGKIDRFFEQMIAATPAEAKQLIEVCGLFAAPTIRVALLQSVCEKSGSNPSPAGWDALDDFSLVERPDDLHVELHPMTHSFLRRKVEIGARYPVIWEAFRAAYLELAESTFTTHEADRDYKPLQEEEKNFLRVAESFYLDRDWTRLEHLYPCLSGYLWNIADYDGYETLDRYCLTAARETRNDDWAAKILSELGYVKMVKGKWEDVEALFMESQTIYDNSPDHRLESARLRRYRAQAALDLDQSNKALELLNEAEAILAQATGAPAERLDLARMYLYSMRMTVHHRRSEPAEAEAAGLAADRLYRRIVTVQPGGNRLNEYKLELGDILFKRGKADGAETAWSELLREREGQPHIPLHAEAQLRLALLFARRGEREAALETAMAALGIFAQHGLPARVDQVIGLIEAAENAADLPEFTELINS